MGTSLPHMKCERKETGALKRWATHSLVVPGSWPLVDEAANAAGC